MDEPIRIGIIGVGQIGKHHYNNYDKIPGAKVVAICDIDTPEAQRVAKLHNLPESEIYYWFREMLKRDDIQAVDVCLHNNLHAPVTIAALEAGKHVYCEKPMAGAYIDAENMYKAAQSLGRKLSIQLSTVFSNEYKAAKYLIDNGKLGKLYHARSVGFRRRGRPFVDGYGSDKFVKQEIAAGGAMYDMGVYHIAAMLHLLGNPEVLTVSGKTYQETAIDPVRFEKSGYNVEELGLGFVRLAGNLTMDIIESWAMHMDMPEGSFLLGSEGGVRLDPFGYYYCDGDLDMDVSGNMENYLWRQHTVKEDLGVYDSPQHHWVATLQGKVDLLPTAAYALNTMLISQGIYLSNRLGREVTAEEIRSNSVSSAILGL